MNCLKIENYKLKIIVTLLVIGGFIALLNTNLFSTSTASAAWYSGGAWTNRKLISINNQKIASTTGSNITNFPMLFSVTDTDLKFTSFGGNVASSTGGDIIFTSADGTTALNYEIEKYASTTGELVAWVKIPFLSSTSTNSIYIYYGNASAPNVAASTWQNTWDANYKMVWHVPDGTTLSSGDSTANTNNGTLGGVTGTPIAATGKIDGAASFDYTKSQIITSPSINVGTVFTASAWVSLNTGAGNYRGILRNDYTTGFSLSVNSVPPGITWDIKNNLGVTAGGNVPADSSWHYVTGVYDGTTATLYVDGVSVDSDVVAAPTIGASTIVAGNITGTGANESWGGILEEMRVSTTNRSADWIATEYNNQSSPSTFYSYSGSEQQNKTAASAKLSSSVTAAGAPGWYSGSWSYRKKISTDYQKVGSTTTAYLNDFPMLVSVIDNDLKFTGSGGKVASSTAGDIIFTSADGTTALNYEIESYASTTGTLVAWVKIPFMSSTSTIPIYMYFGNASAPNVAASTWQNTWDTNFKGVWHMNSNAANTTVAESTSNAHNATTTANTSTKTTTGKVNSALAFNGSTDIMSAGTTSDFDVTSGNFTISFWYYAANTNSDGPKTLIGKGTNTGSGGIPYRGYRISESSGGYPGTSSTLTFTSLNTFSLYSIASTGKIYANTWNYVTFVRSGATGYWYFNGSSGGSGSFNDPYTAAGYSLYLAGNYYGTPQIPGDTWDEPRFSNSARSVDWIKTEYNNQNSPSTFYSYGGLENYNGRINSSGTSAPAMKIRGGVKFR